MYHLIRFLFLHGRLLWKHRKSMMAGIEKHGARMLQEDFVASVASNLEIETDGIHLKPEQIVSYAEQLVYRMYQCQSCVSAGKCEHCFCPVPLNMLEPTKKCTAGKWEDMLPPSEWEQHKLKEGITFSVKHRT